MASPLVIQVLGFGELYHGVLNAIVAFLGDSTFTSLLRLSALIGIIMASAGYLKHHDPMVFGKWIIGYVLVIHLVIMPKTDVAVFDISNQSTYLVANVPVVFALTAHLITNVGVALTEEFETLLSRPDDLTYTKTGSLFGSKLIRAAHDFRITDPVLKAEMDAYLRNCVIGDIRLNHKYTLGELGETTDIWGTVTKKPSPLRMTEVNGKAVTCLVASSADQVDSLRKKLDAEINRAYTIFGISLFGKQCVVNPQSHNQPCNTNYEALFNNHLTKAFDYFQGMTNSTSEIFMQSMMINALGDGIKNYQAFTDSTAGVVNNQVTKSQLQHRWSWAIAGQKAAWFLPILHTILTAMLFCIFPVVLVLTTLPNGIGITKGYLQFFVSLQVWPLLFAFLNFAMTLYGSSQSSQYNGITMVNIDKIDELHSDLAGVSGYLMLMIPFIAKGLVSNLSEAFSGLATSMTGHLQGSAMSVANDAATGSFSLGQTSFYNASANNLSANKHDSNWTDFQGLHTTQTDNGATVTESPSGHRVVNAQPAMSQLAVNLHGSDRVSDALSQSMNESFSNSSQLKTAADAHRQAGLSQLSQFTTSDSNDYRQGEGLSLTTNDSMGQDFKTMEDSLRQWNRHHDVGDQLGHNEAISARFDSSRSLIGKGFKIGLGVSGDASTSLTKGHHSNASAQAFLNSSEGRSYANAYGHMLATAKSNHLDASESKNLNGTEQIAANFAKSDSLMQQSSSEYSHGVQLQQAANHVREHATGVETNLNQPFHDWVYQQHGHAGEAILTQTDGRSIQQQNQWANEFFNAQEGRAAIASQVASALHTSGADLKSMYQQDAAQLNAQHGLSNQYQHDRATVADQANQQGLTPMAEKNLNAAKSQLDHSRTVDVQSESAALIKTNALNADGNQTTITKDRANRQYEFEQRKDLVYSREINDKKPD